MKKSILGCMLLAAAVQSAPVFAETSAPTVIVNEREIYFEDQGPVIQPETGRTLIPLRAVLEECNVKIEWNGETKTVHATAGDNRKEVTLTIGDPEMKVRSHESLIEFTDSVVVLDEAAQIMNERTMIPVRAVVEALGSKVDWDQDTQVINITSRAYMRYLMDQGVLDVNFDPIEQEEGAEVYDAKKALPVLSASTEATQVAEGESFDVYVNLSNTDKIGENPLFTGCCMTMYYDSDVLGYEGYTFVDGEEEFKAVLDASNEDFKGNSVKIVSIARTGMEEGLSTKDGAIMKLTFVAKKAEKTELRISNRVTELGYDTYITAKVGDNSVTFDDVTKLYIDTTPIVINQ